MSTSNTNVKQRRFTASTVIVVSLLLTLGLGLRLAGLGREGFWFDEIFSASYTNLSLFETVVACLRFDVHPPLYYLQLNAWSLFGHSDIWLMLNSVMWGMATLVLIFIVTMHRFDVSAGLIALAFCAVMGSEVYFANELRMYALLSFLMVLSWIAADRVLEDYRFRTSLPLILLLIIIGGLHSFGIIAVSAVLLYVIPFDSWQKIRRVLPTWFGIAFIVGLTLVPWMVNASLRHVSHLGAASFSEIAYTVSGWILGYRAITLAEWIQTAVALLVALILGVAMLLAPQLRRMIACFIIWPLLLAALICIFWKPIWLFRPFAFCAPFLSIAIGALFGQLIAGEQRASQISIRGACVTFITGALMGTGWLTCQQIVTPWKTQFREAAGYLRERVQAGDIVYIPDNVVFWGVARYLVGPQWGSLLKVQDPLNPDHSTVWPGVYRRLGSRTLELLHLEPETRRLDGFKTPLYIGWSPLPELRYARVIWIVGMARAPFDFHLKDVELCPYSHFESANFTELRVFRITCNAG